MEVVRWLIGAGLLALASFLALGGMSLMWNAHDLTGFGGLFAIFISIPFWMLGGACFTQEGIEAFGDGIRVKVDEPEKKGWVAQARQV